MANTSARMLRLLSLLQTHRYWPGGELAERLEVSPRTLRRDVDRLRDLGYTVDAVRGAAGGYQLRAGGSLPPLLLEDDGSRMVLEGEHFSAYVPFAARWPLEVHLVPHRQVPDLAALTGTGGTAAARVWLRIWVY